MAVGQEWIEAIHEIYGLHGSVLGGALRVGTQLAVHRDCSLCSIGFESLHQVRLQMLWMGARGSS